MEVLNKLVKINLIKNKQRTIVSIVGIILSAALITALLGLVASFQESLKQDALESFGNRHVTFYDVSYDDVQKIKEHKEIKSYYLTTLQTAKVEGDYIGIVSIDNKGLPDLENQLLEGRLPSNEDEIIIDKDYALEKEMELGDTIVVTTGNRYIDGYLLNDSNPLNFDEDGNLLEIFDATGTKTYTIVGTSKVYSFLRTQYNHNFYTCANESYESANMYMLYNNPRKYQDITIMLNQDELIPENGKYQIDYNLDYLRWSGYAVGDSTKNVLYTMAGIIAFIIVVTSVFCIRNTFAISVSEKIRLFGMLSSVGATPKQIKKSVLKEGWYLGIIGIPLGILFGILASFILIQLVEFFINSMTANFAFIFKISWEAIIISVLLAAITIYLSAIGSARKASKITEIEAIKNQNEIAISRKKVKIPKLIGVLFNVGGVIAYKNMKRNKLKYRTTVISLVISITSFLAIYYFMEIGFYTNHQMLKESGYNIAVILNDAEDTTIEEGYAELSRFETIEHASITMVKEGLMIEETYFAQGYDGVYPEQTYVSIICVSEEEYKTYIEEAKLNYDEVKEKGILFHNTYTQIDNEGANYRQDIIANNVNEITLFNTDSNYSLDIELVKTTKYPIGTDNYVGANIPSIVVSREVFEKMPGVTFYNGLYINSSNASKLQKEIKEYAEKNNWSVYVSNLEELIDQQRNITILVGIFFYGFISVITLIGITNIFNTITTNMMLRRGEFAILKSIGMTKKEFKNMIRLESIFYGVKSLVWGILFGTGLSYFMYLTMERASFMSLEGFQLPYKAILISILFVFVIIYIIMSYSLSKINKQNIIETIRNENI